jgi:hypothetical protein
MLTLLSTTIAATLVNMQSTPISTDPAVNSAAFAFYSGLEQIREVRRRVAATTLPMTEASLVAEVLTFANADSLGLAGFIQPVITAAQRTDAALSALSGNVQTILADHTRDSAPWLQQRVRALLDRVVAGDESIERIEAARPNVEHWPLAEPVVFEKISGASTERRYAFANITDFAQWSLSVIADPKRPHARNVHRCQLETCPRFFLSDTRSKFCGDECMDRAQKKTASARVMKSRKKKRERLRAQLQRRHK